ncbi:MAG: tRNA pseudouridine(55) synthase TruB [Chloroflexi bacterium RBG_16_50_9]|nr:MAG: tRNA pseudouridine(55) synthase TruB [Chloroflexi bacterium RBG_16_50_9]
MDGILNINKPPGKTSFSIVATVKRLSRERRVGHAGTLDPDASGVLPVCLGRGTRIVEFLLNDTKTYLAHIELGTTTDTYDGSGQIARKSDPSGINQTQLESALEAYRGSIQQTPPMFSAVKHRGQPLYELARAGVQIERKSRTVIIYRLELLSWQPPLATLEIDCSKGTYIRSLAHDLGQSLGCGAYLKSLVRTRCGLFHIINAIPLPQLEEAFRYGYWQHFVYPIDIVLQHHGAIIVNKTTEDIIKTGGALSLEHRADDVHHCRAYTLDGNFLGVLRRGHRKGLWQPHKVLL